MGFDSGGGGGVGEAGLRVGEVPLVGDGVFGDGNGLAGLWGVWGDLLVSSFIKSSMVWVLGFWSSAMFYNLLAALLRPSVVKQYAPR